MRRGGPLKRNTPLLRGKPLERKAGFRDNERPLRKSPLRFRSRRTAREQRTRAALVKRLVAEGRRCEIGPVLAAAGIDSGCTGEVQGMHERRKRSAGGSLENSAGLLAACNRCNDWCEDNPQLARDATGDRLVVRAGDPEWDGLSKRKDHIVTQHVHKGCA